MRSFTIDQVDKLPNAYGGRYISNAPSAAAKKAGMRLIREHPRKLKNSVTLTIRETTRGSAGKTFKYKVSRFYDPVSIERGNEEITYEYKTVVCSKN